MSIIIIGATGMLGSSIMLSESDNQLIGTYFGEKAKSDNIFELDITKKKRVREVLVKFNPDAIINTAAITNVDLCENDPSFALKVHVKGTKYLTEVAKEIGSHFLYISTDSVFDGIKGNYNENAEPNPLNIYAKTKLDGENEALKYKSVVIRTNIYGHNWLPKTSIAEWIRNTLQEEKGINLFHDVYFSPLLVNNLAEILLEIVKKKLTGIFHVSSPEGVTKLDYGRKIASIYGLN